MRKWWCLLLGLTGVFGIAIFLGLLARWEVLASLWPPTWSTDWIVKVGLPCGAVALIPAFLACVAVAGNSRRVKLPGRKIIWIAAFASLALGLWSGALLRKLDRQVALTRRDDEVQAWLPGSLDELKKQGRYDEMVQEMERVLAIHEERVAELGPWPRDCAIGFSYIFVSLHPASDDLPGQLGSGLSHYLYDTWRDGYDPNSAADGLSNAMTRSKHPLLRTIAYWVEQDYAAFEREALAGAAAGDRRMDTMALVAACAFSKDRKAALEKVRPILDRSVGIGKSSDYVISSSEIREFLEGSGTGPSVRNTAFMRPRGCLTDKLENGLHLPAAQ